MKTRFTITDEVFGNGSIEEAKNLYNEVYKDEGWIFDEKFEEVYMILDKEINLNEGDRIDIYKIRIVRWKCINIMDEVIEYILGEE